MADQLRGYYHVRMKCRKYYKYVLQIASLCHTSYKVSFCLSRYIFWFLFDCCTVNAYILQRYFKPTSNSGLRNDFKSFRIRLAQGLIGGYNCRQRYSLPAPVYDVALHRSIPPTKRRRLNDCNTTPTILDGHFPIKGARARCSYCWNIKHRQHESTVRCRKCEAPLCVQSRDSTTPQLSCFELYHTECILMYINLLYSAFLSLVLH